MDGFFLSIFYAGILQPPAMCPQMKITTGFFSLEKFHSFHIWYYTCFNAILPKGVLRLKKKKVSFFYGVTFIWFYLHPCLSGGFFKIYLALLVKNLPAMQETWVWSLGWEDPIEEDMATHSSILAWRIPTDRGAWWATVHRVTQSDPT